MHIYVAFNWVLFRVVTTVLVVFSLPANPGLMLPNVMTSVLAG